MKMSEKKIKNLHVYVYKRCITNNMKYFMLSVDISSKTSFILLLAKNVIKKKNKKIGQI